MRAMSELQKLKKEKEGAGAHDKRLKKEMAAARADKNKAEAALAALQDTFDQQKAQLAMVQSGMSGEALAEMQGGEMGKMQQKLLVSSWTTVQVRLLPPHRALPLRCGRLSSKLCRVAVPRPRRRPVRRSGSSSRSCWRCRTT